MTTYLAVCAAFKDEAPYLREWIEFHRMVGVEHFFLYDNLSADASARMVEPYVREGVVTLTTCSIPYRSGGQRWVYSDALERARDRARWLAFIDVDEFLFTPAERPFVDVLAGCERHPGVVVNWQIYGSSGHVDKPQGLVIENFVQRARSDWTRNRRVKSLVDPARAVRSRGVHFFDYVDDALAVTEKHEPVRVVREHRIARALRRRAAKLSLVDWDQYAVNHSSVKRVSVDYLRINHYAVKSRAEFAAKLNRWESNSAAWRVAPSYFRYHDRNDVHDPILSSYIPELKRRLAEVS